MKKVFAITVLLLNVCFLNAQTPETSDNILKDAYSKAKEENKKVFVKFSASWCGWCRKMDYAMNDTVCKKQFNDNFVIVTLIVDEQSNKKHLENKGADSLILKYNGNRNEGIPFWFILDENGKLLENSYYTNEKSKNANKKSMIGCPANELEVNAFIEILKRTTKINEQDLEKIRTRFRKNEYAPKKN